MEKQFRYPGTRPFQEGDRNLFFGRNADIKNLSELIVLEKMVVLFSKSGYGKSSLLNAGVIPRLIEKESFQVLNIRLNEHVKNPVRLVRYHLSRKAESITFLDSKFNIPTDLPNDLTAILWYYAKSIQFAEDNSKALVLVFDQFEELFNFSNSAIEEFAGTLATLLNLNLPESVRMLLRKKMETKKGLFTEEETDHLLKPLNLKVVFSLRNDRLSLLNQLKGSLSAIFKKTYELQPLDGFQALEALLEPAEKPGDFASPEFTYSQDAIVLILDSLKDKENQRIETFQLQLICQHAEELIIVKAETKSNQLELTATDLGNPEDIFENHYNTIIGSLPADSQLKARILIEDKLIIAGNRVPLPESVIIEEHQVPMELLATLVDKRLLRSEPNTVGGMSFELSHDTLVAPIQKTAKIRRLQETEEKAEKEQLEKAQIQRKLRKTRILLGTAGVALAFSVIAIWFAYVQKNEAYAAVKSAVMAKNYAEEAKIAALNSEKAASIAIVESEKSKNEALESELTAKAALSKAQKFMKAFYFYDDKYALILKRNPDQDEKYAFINKDGNIVFEDRYEKAEAFEDPGFAKVMIWEGKYGECCNSLSDYLLDTTGVKFRVLYQLDTVPYYANLLRFGPIKMDSIPYDVNALDLRQVKMDSLPVMQGISRLELLLLNKQITRVPKGIENFQGLKSLYINSYLLELSAEVGLLKNLQTLDLSGNWLSKLPPELVQLEKLQYLNISQNKFLTLPNEIGELKNLKWLNVTGNQIPKSEIEIIKRLLPKCIVVSDYG
jgi:hypothetical protein